MSDTAATMNPMTQPRTFEVPVDLSGTVGGVDFEFAAGVYEVEVGSDDETLLDYLELGGHLKDPAPAEVPLEKRKKDELVTLATELGVDTAGATKADLVAAIEAAGQEQAPQGETPEPPKE